MRPIYVVLGILSFVCGILCLTNPFESFITIGWLVAIFLLLVGVFFIIMFFQSRQNAQSNFIVPNKPAVGVAGLIFGVLLIVVAILSLVIPSMEEAMDLVILIVFSVWMVVNGFISIFTGVSIRKQSDSGWVFWIVFGVIVVIAGIYGLLHLAIFSEALGLVLGFLLLLYGLELICSAWADPDINL
ncbi:MAG: DUF308 domain-containing protein [Lachnospiraceae bacterium]|nr:DUF308 domain-containing protein [Lachnospiraceae bacterium]